MLTEAAIIAAAGVVAFAQHRSARVFSAAFRRQEDVLRQVATRLSCAVTPPERHALLGPLPPPADAAPVVVAARERSDMDEFLLEAKRNGHRLTPDDIEALREERAAGFR